MKRLFIIIATILTLFAPSGLYAQCAMCRATLENNLTNGDLTIGTTLNTGIMYLFFAPYVALGSIAFFWYLHSKRRAHA